MRTIQITVIIMMLLSLFMATPLMGQSRKEKKNAEKREWQRQQEEKEAFHKEKMESLNKPYQPKEMEISKESSVTIGTRIVTPCKEESFDIAGEYMAGLGVTVGNNRDEGALYRESLRSATASIVSKLLGFVEQGFHDFSETKGFGNGENPYQVKFASGAINAVKKTIDLYANVVCHQNILEDNGIDIRVYVAVQAFYKDFIAVLSQELKTAKVDEDSRIFFEQLEKKLMDNTKKNSYE